MKEDEQGEVRLLLKKVFPPVSDTPRRDLWPAMLRRLKDNEEPLAARPRVVIPWYDWALAAGVAGWLCIVPKFIFVLLYHL
jgi:hypothetical protein